MQSERPPGPLSPQPACQPAELPAPGWVCWCRASGEGVGCGSLHSAPRPSLRPRGHLLSWTCLLDRYPLGLPCLQQLICFGLWGWSCLGVLAGSLFLGHGGVQVGAPHRPCSVSPVTNPALPSAWVPLDVPPGVWSWLAPPFLLDWLVEFLRCSDRKSLALQVWHVSLPPRRSCLHVSLSNSRFLCEAVHQPLP